MTGAPLIITSGFPPNKGGVQRYIYDLYSNQGGDPYRVLTFDHPGSAEFDRTCGLSVTRLHTPKWLRTTKRARLLLTALRIVVREKTPHIHCGSVRPDGRVGYLLKKVTGKDYLTFAHGREMSSAGSSPISSGKRKALIDSKVVIANSSFTRDRLIRLGVSADRIEIVHPGVDTRAFVHMPKSQRLEESLGIKDKRIILSVGRVVERKGFDTMVRALPSIAARVPNVCYLIVGSGCYLSEVRRLAASLGVDSHLKVADTVTDELLPECYSLADAVAMVSRALPDGDCEGFGIVMIEAGACGKPVIGGMSGGMPDAVADGVTGLLVEPTDADQVADAVIRLMEDKGLAANMGAAGRERAVEEFDVRHQAKALRTVIEERFGA